MNHYVERKIQEAMAKGELKTNAFDGQKIDLDWYERLPQDERLSMGMLRSADMLHGKTGLAKGLADSKKR